MSISVLTIDGPSGAGKGSVSRALAKELGWHYLDSGSIYRALAIAVLDKGIALDAEAAIVTIAESMQLAFDCAETLSVRLNGDDITGRLGLETTGNAASIVSVLPAVRQALLQKQKDFKQLPGLVADGRDMGSVVFPDALVKVYLTADSSERAERRHKQLLSAGVTTDVAQLKEEIDKRDTRDALTQKLATGAAIGANAVYIDSTHMALSAVIDAVRVLVVAATTEPIVDSHITPSPR